MNNFAEINQKANVTIDKSVGTLIESYSTTAKKISESGIEAIQRMQKSGEKFLQFLLKQVKTC
ncbi:MAG: hypothetical protein IPF54_26445 [Draconibacterium sp.]|nr:hypothetical protein [Draconibacterium sp.]